MRWQWHNMCPLVGFLYNVIQMWVGIDQNSCILYRFNSTSKRVRAAFFSAASLLSAYWLGLPIKGANFLKTSSSCCRIPSISFCIFLASNSCFLRSFSNWEMSNRALLVCSRSFFCKVSICFLSFSFSARSSSSLSELLNDTSCYSSTTFIDYSFYISSSLTSRRLLALLLSLLLLNLRSPNSSQYFR